MSAFVRAWTRHFAGDHAEALALCRSAAAALPRGSDERSVVVASEVFLLQVGGLGDWRPVQERLLQELRAHGTPHALANAYFNQAQVAAAAGDVALGRRSLEEAEAVGAGADAKCLWHLDSTRGDLTLAAGDPAACDAYLRSIDAALRFGDVHQIYFDLHGIANALVVAGRPEDALETWGVAMSLGEQVGKGLDDLADDDVYGEGRLDAARSEVGPVAADAAIARGRAVAAGRRIEHVRQLLGTAVPSPR
jgi:hypothetical protein